MSALPSLYETFVKLMKCLVSIILAASYLVDSVSFHSHCALTYLVSFWQLENKQEDRDQVVIYFQDMLEVVTRDIMEDTSVLESLHDGSLHERMASLETHSQLFASGGAIRFPIEPLTEAWKEKVYCLCKTS